MHFAYPPRKSSDPPPFRKRSKLPLLRRGRARTFAVIAVGAVLLLLGLLHIFGVSVGGSRGRGRDGDPAREPSGWPPVVIVTTLDPARVDGHYVETIRQNRIRYAQKHGYEVFFANSTDYDIHPAPPSWAKVMAMRHALTKYPECRYVWFLSQDAYIMNPHYKFEDLMRPERLESSMIKDYPVVPPDSIIKTFGHLRGAEVDFVITQDKQGLSVGSFVLRNGEWARFFLETWSDPLYRSYNFQRADTHALEHIVQWHPTILSRLALVPQRDLNSYSDSNTGEQYQDGDLVVRFPNCQNTEPHCESLSALFAQQWQTTFGER